MPVNQNGGLSVELWPFEVFNVRKLVLVTMFAPNTATRENWPYAQYIRISSRSGAGAFKKGVPKSCSIDGRKIIVRILQSCQSRGKEVVTLPPPDILTRLTSRVFASLRFLILVVQLRIFVRGHIVLAAHEPLAGGRQVRSRWAPLNRQPTWSM